MQRQIDFANQDAVIKLVDHATHFGNHFVHFRLIG
jgi:hypothetical protein